MLELLAGATAFHFGPGGEAEGLVMAEQSDGGGARLEIHRSSQPSDQDRRLGQNDHCLVVESGACHYGGVLRWRLAGGNLRLVLTKEAATELGLEERDVVVRFSPGPPSEVELSDGLTRLLGVDLDASAYGGMDRTPTEAEATFLDALLPVYLDLDVWLHEDDDGTPWLMVSHDMVVGSHITDTLRADFDGGAVRGGWSPATLNWDSGGRAAYAEIETGPPDGLDLSGLPVTELAEATAQWFANHEQCWPASERARRWQQ